MSELMGYQYVVLRVVPSAVREEFVNVGVVLYCQQAQFLRVAWSVQEDRVRALWPALDCAEVRAALAGAAATCREGSLEGHPELSGLGPRFGWLAAPRSTVLRPGPRHGGLTFDPAAELARLHAVLVQA
ncbi:MAG: DUF3037 domain-containing protein [Actinomycetota bacterium]|nr:DUF3037 domain-containing protein [Actinomycetota bacterium]